MPFSSILLAAGAAAIAWLAARWQAGRINGDAVRRLREADAHLHSIVDHSSSAIYLKDRMNRFLMVNRRHMELWPEPRDFRPGMKASEIFPEPVATWFAESDTTVLETGTEYTYEEEIPFAEGVRAYVSSKFPVRDETGAIIAIGGISTDITELKHARASITRKEQVLRRLIDVQENEKQRLCHEFHDGLIQYVVASKMLLESLDRGRLPPDFLATLDTVVEHLGRGLDDGRRVIRGIRPAALDDLGLAAAIAELCGQPWPGGPAIAAEVDPALDTAPGGVQTTAYRLVQELVSNACRHSGATHATVAVRRDGAGIEIVVADDGRGFDPHAPGRAGFGLIGVEERVRLAGGEVSVESGPNAGTRITARLPLDAGDQP